MIDHSTIYISIALKSHEINHTVKIKDIDDGL